MSGEVETELKFQLRTQDLAALKTPKAPRHAKIGPAERLNLSSTYYDTEDRRLLAAGLTLRVRRAGDNFEQTVKAVGDAGAALAARREATTALQGERPDIGLFADEETVRLLERAMDGRALSPQFVVDVERTVRIVETRSGDRIEFAVDVGDLTAGDRSLPIREAEFELKGGDLRSLFPVARAAMAGVPIRFSMAAKADLGFRLLDGGGAAEPEGAVAIDVAGDGSVELVLHRVLRSCLRQIATNVAAVDASDDPEGPHQLRVGLRRLRSALKVFAPVIDPSAADRLNQQAKRLGQCVGRARDLDVLIDEIVGVCAGHVDVGGLNRHLEARRKREREVLLSELSGDKVSRFLIDLAAFTEGRGWLSASDLDQSAALSAPGADFARAAIHRRWTKTARKGRDVDALTAEQRHELRKSFKSLRYALEFLGPLIARRDLKSLTKRVKAAQEVLGYLNDVRSAQALVAMVDKAGRKLNRKQAAAVDRSVGFCLGWHEGEAARVWEEAKSTVSLDPKAY